MLTLLRVQVQDVLYSLPASRKPALRRSDAEDALFATDLPLVADDDVIRAFMEEMAERGWCIREQRGWLTLDAPVSAPGYAIPAAPAGECGCCISLLLRHPENAPAQGYIRAVVKAAEAGKAPFERLCAHLHGDFAARLRNHQPLPGALLPYICCAYSMFDK